MMYCMLNETSAWTNPTATLPKLVNITHEDNVERFHTTVHSTTGGAIEGVIDATYGTKHEPSLRRTPTQLTTLMLAAAESEEVVVFDIVK